MNESPWKWKQTFLEELSFSGAKVPGNENSMEQKWNFCSREQKFLVGMLNDYRIFDYRFKCSNSFSFVWNSILELLIFSRKRNRSATTARDSDSICLYWVTPSVTWVASCRRLLLHGSVCAAGQWGIEETTDWTAAGRSGEWPRRSLLTPAWAPTRLFTAVL